MTIDKENAVGQLYRRAEASEKIAAALRQDTKDLLWMLKRAVEAAVPNGTDHVVRKTDTGVRLEYTRTYPSWVKEAVTLIHRIEGTS